MRRSTIEEIKQLHKEVQSALRTSLRKAIRIGQLLEKQRAGMKHGEWGKWLTANPLGFCKATADNYRLLYRRRDQLKILNVRNLSEAYRLLYQPRNPKPPQCKPETPLPTGVRIECCNARDLEIDSGTASLVISDPPYDHASLNLYGVLAEQAAEWLKPGGWCLAYCGQMFLPEILTGFQKHLKWGWMFPIVHNGRKLRMRTNHFRQAWKPVVAFYKRPLKPWWKTFDDLFAGGQREKELHKWQQAESEVAYFIENLSRCGELVVDPFIGSGTTAYAACQLKRSFTGCDIDPAAVATAQRRLENFEA